MNESVFTLVNPTLLVALLVSKGVLTQAEADKLHSDSTPDAYRDEGGAA